MGPPAGLRGYRPVVELCPDTAVPAGADRAFYVGHLTAARGVDTLVETARLLAGSGVAVDIIGAADGTIIATIMTNHMASMTSQ